MEKQINPPQHFASPFLGSQSNNQDFIHLTIEQGLFKGRTKSRIDIRRSLEKKNKIDEASSEFKQELQDLKSEILPLDSRGRQMSTSKLHNENYRNIQVRQPYHSNITNTNLSGIVATTISSNLSVLNANNIKNNNNNNNFSPNLSPTANNFFHQNNYYQTQNSFGNIKTNSREKKSFSNMVQIPKIQQREQQNKNHDFIQENKCRVNSYYDQNSHRVLLKSPRAINPNQQQQSSYSQFVKLQTEEYSTNDNYNQRELSVGQSIEQQDSISIKRDRAITTDMNRTLTLFNKSARSLSKPLPTDNDNSNINTNPNTIQSQIQQQVNPILTGFWYTKDASLNKNKLQMNSNQNNESENNKINHNFLLQSHIKHKVIINKNIILSSLKSLNQGINHDITHTSTSNNSKYNINYNQNQNSPTNNSSNTISNTSTINGNIQKQLNISSSATQLINNSQTPNNFNKIININFSNNMANNLRQQTYYNQNMNSSFYNKKQVSLDNYEMEDILGKGSYGIVKLATDKKSQNKVAIKIYEKFKLSDPNKFKNIRREINILSKMNHPNIVKLYHIIDTISSLNLVMEYVSKNSLFNYLKSRRKYQLEIQNTKSIFKQVIEGINYMHSKNVCHRDIKLENILINQNNAYSSSNYGTNSNDYYNGISLKIIDFGFAICSPIDRKINTFCGTPSYMAPEVVSKRDYIGQPADIWSSGILLYILICGKFPFKGTDEKDLFRKIQKNNYDIPDQADSGARLLVQKMLQLKPEDRPSSSEILKDPWLKNNNNNNESI